MSDGESVSTERRECPLCEWQVTDEVVTETDRMELDYRSERHYEREHCGSVRVTVTLEATWKLHPGQNAKQLSAAALDRFEDEPVPGFAVAYASAEVTEEATDQ
jgi:hypothetical protein